MNTKWLQYEAAANATTKLVVAISARVNVGWKRCVKESQKTHATSQPNKETTIDHLGTNSQSSLPNDRHHRVAEVDLEFKKTLATATPVHGMVRWPYR